MPVQYRKTDEKMKDCLILDIETRTFNNQVNAHKDVFVLAGMYSYKTRKKIITNNLKTIQKIIDDHKTIIGHNIIEYDKIVLERHNITFDYKYILDTLVIAKKRLKTLMHVDPGSYSLGNLAKVLQLKVLKGELDFNILQKRIREWSVEEKQLVIDYLTSDILVTKELFELFYQEFIEFKQFVNERNQRSWGWLKSSSGALGYKILCNFAGLEEEYTDYEPIKEEIGGIVLEPAGIEFNNVWYLDYSSLYPNIFSMFNLFGHPGMQKSEKWFTGNEVFHIKGKYALDNQHKMSKVYEKMFNNRKHVKKTNPKLAFAYKVILNSGYGVMRSPTFKNTYYEHTGSDCCRIGQTMNILIGDYFGKAGFKTVSGDSVAGNSIIEVDGKKIKIKTFFDKIKIPIQKYGNKEIKNIISKNYLTKALKIYNIDDCGKKYKKTYMVKNNINKIIRHKCKKQMYEITTETGKKISVTKDHSLIIKRDKKILNLPTSEIKIGDKVFVNTDEGFCQFKSSWNKGMRPKEWMTPLKYKKWIKNKKDDPNYNKIGLNKGMSSIEKILFKHLKILGFEYEPFTISCKNQTFVPDFVNKKNKIIIELNGSGHKNKNDKLKKKILEEKGYIIKYIFIDEKKSRKSNIEKILSNKLKELKL